MSAAESAPSQRTPSVAREFTPDPNWQRVRLITGFEKLLLAHFGVIVVFTSWSFGGQAVFARQFLLGWGTLGMALFVITAWREAHRSNTTPAWCARHLWPLMLFDLFVSLSCLNPTFRTAIHAGELVNVLMPPPHAWLPSSARPDLTLRELWLVNGIILSCACLYVGLQSRRAVRTALFIMAANGVILAIFGTLQKLVHAKGLWFGLVPSPQPLFFSTFVYHNHWGAFTLLNSAVCLALLFHYLRKNGNHRNVWHSPAPVGALATLLLAASLPLSGSRSSTLLICLLLMIAAAHFLLSLMRRRKDLHESSALPAAALVLTLALAIGAITYLSRDTIITRTQLTVQQVEQIRNATSLNARLQLYVDTWRMATEKPWFGWGLESYAHVFGIFNTQRPIEPWFPRPFYAEAHNDWLQSLAEVGVIGTGLLLLLGLLPLWSVIRARVESVVPRYLLAGCGLLLLYAVFEFPLANPAVLISFGACFYCAVRYLQLELSDRSTRT
ncbi:MAG: O-antigen ligase family protein [Opitutaceae bacterium]|nr:O-antigen ligase family protein [Opitutaceae bacterium]